jgi:hypothetical protein
MDDAGRLTATGWDGDDLDNLMRDLGESDPGAPNLAAFAGVTGAGAGEGTFADATRVDADARERVALTLSLSLAQRSIIMAAFGRAKALGYPTQPEAIEQMARTYMEVNKS